MGCQRLHAEVGRRLPGACGPRGELQGTGKHHPNEDRQRGFPCSENSGKVSEMWQRKEMTNCFKWSGCLKSMLVHVCHIVTKGSGGRCSKYEHSSLNQRFHVPSLSLSLSLSPASPHKPNKSITLNDVNRIIDVEAKSTGSHRELLSKCKTS